MTNTAKLSGGQKVIAPALMGGGKVEAFFVRNERRVNRHTRRAEVVTIIRYRRGGAEFAYAPSMVRKAN